MTPDQGETSLPVADTSLPVSAESRVAVAIIGGGPAGLTAAAALAETVPGTVLVLEREGETGGIPRHSDHLGYGMRDLNRFLTGPDYARRLTGLAAAAGAVLETSAMMTGWHDARTLEITSPRGRRVVHADAVVLATGARERPRPARYIPGDRPAGIYTTGQLQNEVHVHHQGVGRRAVVIGAELVSWSAVLTLREAGCRTVLMTTEYPKSESYAAFSGPGRIGLRVPVAVRTRIARINGRERVESVEIEDVDTGERRIVECDTVITTGDWIPDHELARAARLDMDPATAGPKVDMSLSTSGAGVFAIGNLVHPVDTADGAALDGRHVAGTVRRFLDGIRADSRGLELITSPPLRWVTPQVLRPSGGLPPRARLLLWCDEFRNVPRVIATQDGVELRSTRLPWPAAPGRIFRVPFSLVTRADPAGGPVLISLS